MTGYNSRLNYSDTVALNNATINIGSIYGNYGGNGIYNYDPNNTAVLTMGTGLTINRWPNMPT